MNATANTTDSIKSEARAWFDFASARCRFDVQKKALEAFRFSLEKGAKGFTIPTKLEGTSRFQDTLEALSGTDPYKQLYARVVTVPDHAAMRHTKRGVLMQRVELRYGANVVGYVQRKHARWLIPLLDDGNGHGIRFYTLQVTGGGKDKPTRGLNIAIAGAGARAARMLEWEQAAETVAA